jgi:hypothetical protein
MSSEKHHKTDRNIITDCRNIDKSQLSPMYQHYVEVKEQYPNALLLYRVGDFFECFFQDAVTIARELELVQTSKEGGKASPCGRSLQYDAGGERLCGGNLRSGGRFSRGGCGKTDGTEGDSEAIDPWYFNR